MTLLKELGNFVSVAVYKHHAPNGASHVSDDDCLFCLFCEIRGLPLCAFAPLRELSSSAHCSLLNILMQ